MNVFTQISELFKDSIELVSEYSKKKFVREAMILGAVALVMLVGKGVYTWHVKRQEVRAFAGLLEVSKAYEQAVQKAEQQANLPQDQREANPWEDVELLLESIASANSWSRLAPFFTIYQVELALTKYNDYDRATALMEKAVSKLSKKSVFYDMFNLKRIKMLLDSADDKVVAKAVKELQAIADNQANYYHQEALYLLANYYAFTNDMAASIEALKKLAASKIDHAIVSSPAVKQAQETLTALHISL